MSEIRLYAANFAPKTWAFCAGQTLNISTNQALFSLLGTTYGGNGTTNFQLPDFRGRVPAGTGSTNQGVTQIPLGGVLGQNTVTALLTNLPAHTHNANGSFTMQAYSDSGDSSVATNTNLASLQGLYSNKAATGNLKTITPSVTINTAGGNQPIAIQQPYLGLNYIICIQGIYPSRN